MDSPRLVVIFQHSLPAFVIDLDRPWRCPITLQPLLFEDFRLEVLDPEHGGSQFQVGHLDPLKLDGGTWSDGHRADNIGWISENGNRIQGRLSAEETREMLKSIWREYEVAGLFAQVSTTSEARQPTGPPQH